MLALDVDEGLVQEGRECGIARGDGVEERCGEEERGEGRDCKGH